MMFNDKNLIMAAVHILIFGEMAGFKIVSFIATHVKMIFFFHGAMKKNSANQNSPIRMKTTDIKLFRYKALYDCILARMKECRKLLTMGCYDILSRHCPRRFPIAVYYIQSSNCGYNFTVYQDFSRYVYKAYFGI